MSQNAQENIEVETGANSSTLQSSTPPPSTLNQEASLKVPTRSALRSGWSQCSSPSMSEDYKRKLVETLYEHLRLPGNTKERYRLIIFMDDILSSWTLRDKKADMESNDFKVVNKLTKDFEILRTDFTFNGADILRARTIAIPTYFRDGVDDAYKIMQTEKVGTTPLEYLWLQCEAFVALCDSTLCEYIP
jgi:hypothetical protein